MTAIKIERLHISGTVQGVGYRWWMVQAAERLGVEGWVRNRRDGSVEAFVRGPAVAVDALAEWAHRGPPAARVSQVRREAAEDDTSVTVDFVERPTV